MEACIDEKWKLSKKGSRSGRAPVSSSSDRNVLLSRSYSASVSSTRDSSTSSCGQQRRSSGSTAAAAAGAAAPRPATLSKKCAEAVKEQRARFYIMRRCVSMLVCWRDY